MVSKSRISPTRITSGSSRNAERNASLNPCVLVWTSRWFIRDFFTLMNKLYGIFNSQNMGIALIVNKSIIEAKVVLLPEPVGPVTKTIPRG